MVKVILDQICWEFGPMCKDFDKFDSLTGFETLVFEFLEPFLV